MASIRKKKKLKEEYKGLKGKELGEIRAKGIDLDEVHLHHSFCYLGDTHISIFEKNPEILKFPVVIVECTFLSDDADIIARCDRDGHIYWKALEPIVTGNPNTKFVLIHFSLRYSVEEIVKFFNDLVNRNEAPLVLDNIVIFAGEHSEGRDKDG